MMIHPTGQTYVTVGCIYFLPTLGFPIVVIETMQIMQKCIPRTLNPHLLCRWTIARQHATDILKLVIFVEYVGIIEMRTVFYFFASKYTAVCFVEIP